MPVELQRALGAVIRGRRTLAGYSQETFADIVGVHRTYIGSIERGERNVSLDNLAQIARALRISLSALIREAEVSLAPPARRTKSTKK